jgi:phage tail-like protein
MIQSEAGQKPSVRSLVPAIYRGASDDDPLQWLMSQWQMLYCELEDARERFPEMLDPRRAADAPPPPDFLGWLARLLTIDPDDEVFRDVDGGRPRLREAIGRAKDLYPTRGTRAGLRALIKVYLEEDVVLLERAWPIGMTIGESSTIEVDTFLIDRPASGERFTVLWRPPSTATQGSIPKEDLIAVRLADRADTGSTGMLLRKQPSQAGTERLLGRLDRLRRLLDKECPAHLACFVGIDTGQHEPRVVFGALVIGVTSTIGMCCIEATC